MKHQNIINFLSESMWLATETQMEAVRQITESILNGDNTALRAEFLADRHNDEEDNLKAGGVTRRGATAIVPLMGAISPRANVMSAHSGGVSAELFTANINALAVDDSVRTIVIRVDSGGGNVHGIAAAANAVRNARKTKRVISIAEFDMCSAAYWIGSAAEKVFVTPTSTVGSIGVIAVLKFNAEEDQKRVTIIRSVPGKADVNPHEPLTDEARKKIQTNIDQLHVAFVEAISLNRNISMSKANKLADGTVKTGASAVDSGLADGVVEGLDAVLANIDSMDNLEGRISVLRESYVVAQTEITELSAEIVDYETRLDEAKVTIGGLEATLASQESDTALVEFETVLDAAIDSGRIGAGLKQEWISDFSAGDVTLSIFSRMVSNISAGSVVPSDPLTPDAEPKADDPLKPSNDLERKLFAQFGLKAE